MTIRYDVSFLVLPEGVGHKYVYDEDDLIVLDNRIIYAEDLVEVLAELNTEPFRELAKLAHTIQVELCAKDPEELPEALSREELMRRRDLSRGPSTVRIP
jgi:hypothetical protein